MTTQLLPIDLRFEHLDACPLCGSSSLLAADPTYNICTCTCGFVCDNPRPVLESIAEFYSAKGKYQPWVDRDHPYQRLWRRRLKTVLRHAKHGNILDIGAGIGQFLSIARPHFTSAFGTELSSSGVNVAKDKYGLDLTLGDIDSLSLAPGSFDNITLFHVLEHVHDPLGLLRRCHDLLSPNGVVFVCVPNDVLSWGSRVKAIGKRMKLAPFRKFSSKFGLPLVGTSSEIHLSHFTPHSLANAAKKAGFAICEMGLDPYFAVSWKWTVPYFLYLGLHVALYRLTGTNHYQTIVLVGRKL